MPQFISISPPMTTIIMELQKENGAENGLKKGGLLRTLSKATSIFFIA